MSKDYKHRIPGHRSRRSRLPWLVAGAAVAAALGVLFLVIHLLSDADSTETVPMQVPPPQAAEPDRKASAVATEGKEEEGGKPKAANGNGDKKGETATQPAKPPEPRFTFYKILPEKEVIISESEITEMRRDESIGKKKPDARGYLIQAGSFTGRQDAEKLKAQLAQLNIKAKLEMIKLENTTWYRVKTGPYATMADVDKVRERLRSNKIDSVVQRAAR